jgi:hypothetical protein
MNVEIGIEAAQFPRTEYINGIFVALSTNGFSPRSEQKWFETGW